MAKSTPQAAGRSQVSLTEGLANSQPQSGLKPQINLFLSLIGNTYGDNIRLNEMTGKPERFDRYLGDWVEWRDVDDSRMAAYMQSSFGLYAPRMLEAATGIYFEQHRVNPLTDLIDSLKWDGQHRIERFLIDVIKCDDSDYNREVSRLIFAGGIHRAYRPGCKFDDMPVLIGKQGGGKSTLVRWLAMEDRFYGEIKTISGKEATEALRGVWIGEVAELMAMTRKKEVEAVKAFITAQEDHYRAPWGKHPETLSRRCVFIGTTNDQQFLSDKTGNRRFYPVTCAETGYDLFDRETEIRSIIAQCWAEALALYRQGNLPPYANRELLSVIKARQADAEEDDWRVGAIYEYLQSKTKPNDVVCVIELWHRALGQPLESKPARSDSIEISKIMTTMEGWERTGKAATVPPWGVQKVYRRVRGKYFPF